MANNLNKSFRDLQKEVAKQTNIIFCSAIVVMWRGFGFRQKRIQALLEKAKQTVDEIASDTQERSAIQMLDEECDIVLRLDGDDRDYKDIIYLNGSLWKRKRDRLNTAQVIYANQQQKKYCAPNILAMFCLTLHRLYGFGYERICRFIAGVDEIRRENGEDLPKYHKLFTETTGLDVTKMPFYEKKL